MELRTGDEYMYSGEHFFERFLVLVGLLCVPWMLLAKPFMMMQERKKKHMQLNTHGTENGESTCS